MLHKFFSLAVLVFSAVLGTAIFANADEDVRREQGLGVHAASDPAFGAMETPLRRPMWQRPAPVTWSSRFNVRWEARWSTENKYMV